MNINDLLQIHSLDGAKLIAGKNGILNEVSGVNVLEAIDIENWGRSGEVILTSFFAMQDLDNSAFEVFFQKLYTIGISALILKVERLVNQIPDRIIELCDKYSIPLIQIGKSVKYESIILDILGPIINKNVQLLNKYYEVHNELTSLALKMPSMNEIVGQFKKMMQRDVSLINTLKGTEVCTNPGLCNAAVISKKEIPREKYMNFHYERSEVVYKDTSQKTAGTQIRARIPYLGFYDYEIVIHELQNQINSEDFMIVENAVKFLQMELLKRYAISQNMFQQKNSIISDLLNGRLYEDKDMDEVLDSLEISKYSNYQIVLIKLYQKDGTGSLNNNPMTTILRQLRNRFRSVLKNTAFLESSDRIVFLLNYNNDENGFTSDSVKKLMQPLEESNLFTNFHYYISISSVVEKLDIPRANREVLDTQKVLRLFHDSSTILPYEELGIYKLFLESNNLDGLEKFVPAKISKFRHDYPQLFETLEKFLDTNQNYTLTSEKLFLHPKTVRYRIDKIKDILGTEFSDPEEILQIQVASRLFKLIK